MVDDSAAHVHAVRASHRVFTCIRGITGREWSVLALLLILLPLVATAPVSGDLGWQLLIGRRLLAGDRLYVDIAAAEMHPPLHMWLVAAAEWLARLTQLPDWSVAFAATTLAAAFSVGVAYRLSFRSPTLLAALGFAGVAVAGGYYAGGEQLAVIGILPYLAATCRTMAGLHVRRRAAFAIGLAAGLGMAMKPHFALVWLAVEIYNAWRAGWRSFFRVQSLTVVGVWLAYIAATWILTPEFFTIARWAARLYPEYYPVPISLLLLSWTTLLLLLSAALVALCRPSGLRAQLAVLALVAGGGMWAVAVVQGKLMHYHWIPAQALAVVGVAAALPARSSSRLAIPAALAAIAYMYTGELRVKLAMQAPVIAHDSMRAAIMQIAPRGPVLTLSDQLVVAFPLVNELGADWSSPYQCFWMARGLSRTASGEYAYRTADQWSPLERELFDSLWSGIEKRPPRVIILQRDDPSPRSFDYRRFFEADPRLRVLLSQFELDRRVGRYEVLRPRE